MFARLAHRRLRIALATLSVLAVAALSVFLTTRGGAHTHAARAPAVAAGAAAVPDLQAQAASGGYLGVRVTDQNGQALVQGVIPGSPADKAGVKQGDVITAVDSTQVHSSADLRNALSSKKSGDTVSLTVNRNGASQQLSVTLGELPARGGQSANRGFLGVTVQNATDADKQQYNLSSTDGALVSSVQSGGAAGTAGIKQGDLITAVNGAAVHNVTDLTNALKNSKPGDSVTIQYQRAGAQQSASVKLGTRPAGGGFGNGVLPNLPSLGGLGAALGQNFDRFISTETKTKDQNGAVHTDTTIGGTVKSATDTQVVVTPNGGGSDQTFTIDQNTRILGLPRGGSSAKPAQGDKVLVTTRDSSTTATSIVIVPSGNAGNGNSGPQPNQPNNGNGGSNRRGGGNRGPFQQGQPGQNAQPGRNSPATY